MNRTISICGIIFFSLAAISLGTFLFIKPSHAIEMQKKFYEKINWRIEPVSMRKEIKNTRITGIFLLVITLLISAYGIIKFNF